MPTPQNTHVTVSRLLSMFAPLWLAVAGLPVFQLPIAEAPDRPAAIAMAAGDVSLRRPCLQLRCAGAEWEAPPAARTYAYAESGRGVVRTELPGAPLPGVRKLPAPRHHDWMAHYASTDRVSARYGTRVLDKPNTGVDVEVGTGYRWRPYVDNGGADTGPVARGRVEVRQRLGEKAKLTQQTRVEAGRDNTFVRNSLGVEVQLKPKLKLRSDVEVRHDSAANGGDGRTDTTGSVQVRYAF